MKGDQFSNDDILLLRPRASCLAWHFFLLLFCCGNTGQGNTVVSFFGSLFPKPRQLPPFVQIKKQDLPFTRGHKSVGLNMLLSSSRNGYGADFASSSYNPMHQQSNNNNTATSFTQAEDQQNPRIAPEIEGAIDAARRGDVQFLHDWVARGGDFQAKLDNSYVSLTLLHLAACEGDEVATHTLLRAGAAVDFVENHEGYSSLMIAGRYGHVGVMRLLLGSGASINLPDTLGHTALHYCATSGQLLGAQLLLAEGADTEAVNDFNRTALDLAVSHSHVDIANAIRQKKAENGSRDDGRISAWLQAIDMPQYIDVLLGCGWDDIDFIAVSLFTFLWCCCCWPSSFWELTVRCCFFGAEGRF